MEIINTKNKITVTVYSNCSTAFSAKQTVHFVDDENTERFKTVRIADLKHTAGVPIYGTDLFNAMCLNYAPQLVYTCLKTNYTNAPHPHTLQLMRDCIQYAKKYANRQLEQLENDFAELKMQVKKLHFYKNQKLENGTVKRTECLPYTTLEFTENGKQLLSEYHFADNTALDDLMSETYTAFLELLNAGLLHTPADFWNFRTYAYRKINNFLMAQRSFSVKAENIDAIIIKAKNRKSRTAEKQLDAVEKRSSREQLKQLLLFIITKNADKRQNANLIYSCLIMSAFDKQINTDIAKKLAIDEKQVRRNLAYAQNILAQYRNGALKSIIMDIAN